MKTIFRHLAAWVPGLILVVLWQIAVQGSPRREFLFASPILVARVALKDLFEGRVLVDIGATAMETILGLFAGSVLGTLAGLLIWSNMRIAAVIRPYVVILGAVPVFALAPMMIIWFGTGIVSKIVMASFSTSIVSLVQAYDGARSASLEHLQVARAFGANKRQVLLKIIVPSALMWVLAGFRMNIGFALIGAFIGEFVSSEVGLGHYILRAGGVYDVPRVILGIILMSLLALAMTAALNGFEKIWFPWSRRPEVELE